MLETKFKKGDIIIRTSEWGDTIALVTGVEAAQDTFPDDLPYYQLLYLTSPYSEIPNSQQLATWIVDKIYKLKS